jgi:hypothetical protein
MRAHHQVVEALVLQPFGEMPGLLPAVVGERRVGDAGLGLDAPPSRRGG